MNQEVELLGLFLKLMGGKVGSTGYLPEKCNSKKGKRDAFCCGPAVKTLGGRLFILCSAIVTEYFWGQALVFT